MKSALVLNGELEDLEWARRELAHFDQIIAVDGGLCHLDKLGIRPDRIIGDLDSTPPHLLEKYCDVPTNRFEQDKDETDLELALERVEGEAALFGATGLRTDHFMATLALLARRPGKITLHTPLEKSWVVTGQEKIACTKGQTLSLMPLFGPAIATSRGLKWELDAMRLDETRVSLSNIALQEEVALSISEGKLLLSLVLKP